MLFYSFFKTLVGKNVTVELKNDVALSGTLTSVDPFLNLKLTGVSVAEAEKYPYLLSVKDVFIRGSVIRYVTMEKGLVDTTLLQAATRRELDLIKEKQNRAPSQTVGAAGEEDEDDE